MPLQEKMTYVLGLDLGAESLGWAVLETRDGEVVRIERTGVHTFDAGVEGDIESGKDQSRAAVRREARLPRRQLWRRANRRRKILRILQHHGLLPPGEVRTPEQIHDLFLKLDADLRAVHLPAGDDVAPHMLPYRLRARALDHKLEPWELGRVFYHLAQRRGFLSNRRSPVREGEDEGQVKAGISELAADIKAKGARTLGEYLAGLDPRSERVRRRWTARAMFLEEFDRIWAAQAPHHPCLTEDLRKRLHRALFFQRPLKSQKGLVGRCELMPGRRRAAMALPIAQRFRLLQKVNDLKIRLPDGEDRFLTPEERAKLARALDAEGDMTFAAIRHRKCLGLPREATFNLQEGGEKKLPGNRTYAKLREALGNRWDSLSAEDRNRIVLELLSFQKPEALARRLMKVWNLDEPTAAKLSEVRLEDGYARHCRKAIERLLPLMEAGLPYATARKEAFPESFTPGEPEDLLPPVKDALQDLRNPAVCRALTELRKVVNAIIRRYGKPERIRIELANDLKRPRKQRAEISKLNRDRQQERERAAAAIRRSLPGLEPRRADIEKWMLAEECKWICPYTGRSISAAALLGPTPQFDVEHIWPMSRSLDNTFANKTLCYHEENRDRKGNRTPWEAYGADTEKWDDILARVRRFRGPLAREKLRRFTAREIPQDFTDRQLQDTRYACRLAADYLGRLYGGRVDPQGKVRIDVRPGGLTAHVRNELMLHAILDDGGTKTRSDHRHHAVDALAVGLTSQSMVQQLQTAAGNALKAGRRLFAPVPEPWPGFLEDARRSIEQIRVSRRPNRRVAGKLHADTLYSRPIAGRNGDVRHVRKELRKLTVEEINRDQIVDPVIRRLVQDKYQELCKRLGGGNVKPDKVFADPANHPTLNTRDGRKVPIHKVRLLARARPWAIGAASRLRYVSASGGSNHHLAVVARLGPDGREERWEDHVITRLEAMQRLARGEPIVQTDWGPDRRLVMVLIPNDYLTMQNADGVTSLYRVMGISEGDTDLRLHHDGRRKQDVIRARERVRVSAEKLRKRGAKRVEVTLLGEVKESG